MSAEWLDCFEAVLQALKVRLEMMANVLSIAEEGIFEVHNNRLGGNHMLAKMAHITDILGLHQCLVVRLGSRWMGHGRKNGERLERVPAKKGNYAPVEDEIHFWVVWIECICLVYFLLHYPMLSHCHLGIVVSQGAHHLEPLWLSLAAIHTSILYVNKKMIVNTLSIQLVILNAAEYTWEYWR